MCRRWQANICWPMPRALPCAQRGRKKGACRWILPAAPRNTGAPKAAAELLGKAVNHSAAPQVWDGTGGLGRDAFVLASLGLAVNVFEQHPAVACLLADGLRRAADEEIAEIAARITLHHGDTCALMPALAAAQGRPDVVYLDPMYPERKKAAAVKKEMAYFHGLVGAAQDEAALLAAARAVAKKRVVVKRPRLGDFFSSSRAGLSICRQKHRFDVYLPDAPCCKPIFFQARLKKQFFRRPLI